eukprot:2094358-Alexandrium_andersonii.AAC.1
MRLNVGGRSGTISGDLCPTDAVFEPLGDPAVLIRSHRGDVQLSAGSEGAKLPRRRHRPGRAER